MQLVDFLTTYTDYLANEKIQIKDIGIIRMFNGPFKWDLIKVDRAKLGKAESLLNECF